MEEKKRKSLPKENVKNYAKIIDSMASKMKLLEIRIENEAGYRKNTSNRIDELERRLRLQEQRRSWFDGIKGMCKF